MNVEKTSATLRALLGDILADTVPPERTQTVLDLLVTLTVRASTWPQIHDEIVLDAEDLAWCQRLASKAADLLADLEDGGAPELLALHTPNRTLESLRAELLGLVEANVMMARTAEVLRLKKRPGGVNLALQAVRGVRTILEPHSADPSLGYDIACIVIEAAGLPGVTRAQIREAWNRRA